MNLFIQTHNYSCYYVLLSRIISQFQFCCKYADIPKNALHFRTLPFNFYQLLMYFNGLTAAPPMYISKCTCGPVERPVLPLSAIGSPCSTFWPTFTSSLLLCAYRVSLPSAWLITTLLPVEGLHQDLEDAGEECIKVWTGHARLEQPCTHPVREL